jgi:SpoVK/Ycf46/Vps4 family AAA+-type ATPase
MMKLMILVNQAQSMDHELLCYDDLLDHIAAQCEGFSGASLAGIARAAASHALERTVNATSKSATNGTEDQSIMDCYVTKEDLELAVKDILESSGDFDWTEDKVDNASPN